MDQAAAKETATRFASAQRAGPQDIDRQTRLIAGQKLLGVLPDAVPCILLVVNEHRQIVLANERLLDLLSPGQRQAGVLGRRPGEVLGCVHAFENDEGCGTTESCSLCGAVNAMLTSLHGGARVEECRITRANGEALDLRVWTTPLALDGEQFTVFAALDISHEKRRQALERIFLHDIGNVASGLKWYTELLERGNPDKSREFQTALGQLSRELLDEIDGQRTLVRAESGELVFTPERLRTRQLLQEAVELYSHHPVSHERHLHLDPDAEDIAVTSDRTLLSRVLCNLIKNALEACRAGQTVTVGCSRPGDTIEFWVHNPGVMPHAVQLQVFQRSFSTKGVGRGLGTYSIKLLTERYLQGRVSFTSTPEQGTTFKVHYPLAPNA
jgi:signal transduction histidine kinase